MSDIAKTVGQRLRNYRVARGMSQQELAAAAGLHPTYIGQAERGEKNLTIETLEKITLALSVPIAEVFDKVECRFDERNYPLMAYELLQRRSEKQQEIMVRVLAEIDELVH